MEHISPSIFYQYFTCPHWPWFERFGDETKRGEFGELQKKLLEQGVANEEKFMAEFTNEKQVVTIVAANWQQGLEQTKKAMAAGADFIYHAYLQDRTYQGIPDLLMRVEGKSKFGAWQYEPVDIKSGYELKDEYKYQLVLYALLLEIALGVRPKQGHIITASHEFISFPVDNFMEKFFDVLEKIEAIIGGEKPPLQLTKSCMNSPWYACCVEQAEATDDIALLYKVDKRALGALHEAGINTVEDARHIDPEILGDSIPFLKKGGLERMKMQAESLKTKKIILRKPVKMPTAANIVHFDIEGDPLLGLEYLFGFLIEGKNGAPDEYKAFVAEKPEDERKMWREFLDWLAGLPTDMVIFHYATYEKSRLTMLARRYGRDMSEIDHVILAAFAGKLFDLNDIVKDNFVFPLYFYGLKQIGKFLGFHWDSAKAGGAQSIFWYEEWLKTNDREILNTIIQYNKDDVRATKFLKDWIVNYKE